MGTLLGISVSGYKLALRFVCSPDFSALAHVSWLLAPKLGFQGLQTDGGRRTDDWKIFCGWYNIFGFHLNRQWRVCEFCQTQCTGFHIEHLHTWTEWCAG